MTLHKLDTQNSSGKNMDIWKALKDLVKNQGVTITKLASELDYSHSTVSQYINKEDYCSKELEVKAAEFLKKLADAKADAIGTESKKELGFVLIADALAVMGLCARCAAEKELGVIIGHAGIGKTTAIQEYCKKNPEAVYLRADVTMSAKELLIEIGEKIGVILTYGTQRFMLRKIIARLRERPRPLIIDEADLLITHTVKKMEILRTIYDEARVGLILAGMPRLKGFLQKGPSLKENLAQFYSRVGYLHELEGLSRNEASQILEAYNVSDTAKEELILRATNPAFGGLRRFSKALKRSLALADQRNGQITREIVREADGLLLDLVD